MIEGIIRDRNITGHRSGRLVAVKKLDKRNKCGNILWECICDCGNTTTATPSDFKIGHKKSCGCLHTYAPGVYAKNLVLAGYISGAKKRNLEWNISEDLFESLIKSECYFCGKKFDEHPVQKLRTDNGDCAYNGIDRLDNSLGYKPDNVVACCIACNKAKMKMSENEFLNWIKRVYNYRIKKENHDKTNTKVLSRFTKSLQKR